MTDGGTTVETYGYDAFSNRLLSVSDGAATRSFGYAADGSVVSDDRGTDAFDLTYDSAGRLAAIDKNGAPAATYAYDAFGRRVHKDPAVGSTTHYHYDPDGRLLAESSDAGVPEREYIWLPLDFAGDRGQAWALPLALVTDAGTAGPRIHYLHTDQLGTPVAMTSAGFAQLEWSATFRPFGEAHAITGTESLALRFPGQFFDPETGFHQNWHRDYDPRLGRYLQSDPIGLDGGLNTYAYVNGNPVSLVDSTGEIAFVPIVIGIGAGYAFDYLLEKYKKEHCTCQSTPLGPAGNSALGGALGGTGPFASKLRGGVAGGGRAGAATSSFSQLNHAAASRGWYSVATRNRITKVLRKVPYAGAALAAYEIYDALSCD